MRRTRSVSGRRHRWPPSLLASPLAPAAPPNPPPPRADEPAGPRAPAAPDQPHRRRGPRRRARRPAESVVSLEWQQTEMVLTLGRRARRRGRSGGLRDLGQRGAPARRRRGRRHPRRGHLDALFQTDPDLVIVEHGSPAARAARAAYDVPVLVIPGADATDPVAQMKETFTLIASRARQGGRPPTSRRLRPAVDDARRPSPRPTSRSTEFVYADAYVVGSTLSIRPFGQGSLRRRARRDARPDERLGRRGRPGLRARPDRRRGPGRRRGRDVLLQHHRGRHRGWPRSRTTRSGRTGLRENAARRRSRRASGPSAAPAPASSCSTRSWPADLTCPLAAPPAPGPDASSPGRSGSAACRRAPPRSPSSCWSLVAGWHLTQGTTGIGATELIDSCRRGDPDGPTSCDSRLPRLLAGLVVGVALGAAGALFQSLARNALASPDTLAVNAGATSPSPSSPRSGCRCRCWPTGAVAFVGGLIAAGWSSCSAAARARRRPG